MGQFYNLLGWINIGVRDGIWTPDEGTHLRQSRYSSRYCEPYQRARRLVLHGEGGR